MYKLSDHVILVIILTNLIFLTSNSWAFSFLMALFLDPMIAELIKRW